jgi:hypothetical protein
MTNKERFNADLDTEWFIYNLSYFHLIENLAIRRHIILYTGYKKITKALVPCVDIFNKLADALNEAYVGARREYIKWKLGV